jgi:hypothetical protein
VKVYFKTIISRKQLFIHITKDEILIFQGQTSIVATVAHVVLIKILIHSNFYSNFEAV